MLVFWFYGGVFSCLSVVVTGCFGYGDAMVVCVSNSAHVGVSKGWCGFSLCKGIASGKGRAGLLGELVRSVCKGASAGIVNIPKTF